MNADGTGQRNVSKDAHVDTEPSWSPDGTRIAFTSLVGYENDSVLERVFVMNATGGARRNLSGRQHGREPAWSADGRKIAFSGYLDQEQILVINADGTGQTSLTNAVGPDRSPTWSPNGTKIAFTRQVWAQSGGVQTEIYLMDADGTGQSNLTRDEADEFDPAWSPDGTKIAFGRSVGHPGPTQAEIFVMNTDGTGQTNVSNSPLDETNAAWSPDGSRIAFTRKLTPIHSGEIFVMNANGRGQRNLTRNPAHDFEAAWSPDGRRIAFVTSQGDRTCWVPRVVGRPLARARAMVRDGNCSVGRINSARSRRPRGQVIRQKPRGGARMSQGFRVRLVVSRGRR